VEQFFGVPMEI